jgi:hypothetical protein
VHALDVSGDGVLVACTGQDIVVLDHVTLDEP